MTKPRKPTHRVGFFFKTVAVRPGQTVSPDDRTVKHPTKRGPQSGFS